MYIMNIQLPPLPSTSCPSLNITLLCLRLYTDKHVLTSKIKFNKELCSNEHSSCKSTILCPAHSIFISLYYIVDSVFHSISGSKNKCVTRQRRGYRMFQFRFICGNKSLCNAMKYHNYILDYKRMIRFNSFSTTY